MSLGKLFQCLTPITKYFPLLVRISLSATCNCYLLSFHGVSLRHCLLSTPLQVVESSYSIPPSPLFSRLSKPTCLSLSFSDRCSIPQLPLWPCVRHPSVYWYLLFTREPRTGLSTPGMASGELIMKKAFPLTC